MRSPGPVTPTCGDHHWSALIAAGRVAGEGSAPAHPPSDAVDGMCVCQSKRCPCADSAQGWIWCSPWGSHALCVTYFLVLLLPASLAVTSRSLSSSCPLLGSTALSQQPESGAAGAGQGRAQPVPCSPWLPPPAQVCSGPIQSWMFHPVKPAPCPAARTEAGGLEQGRGQLKPPSLLGVHPVGQSCGCWVPSLREGMWCVPCPASSCLLAQPRAVG